MDLTDSGIALTNAVLDLFRLNGRMLARGDRLVAPLGLTSARWQVLGAIGSAARPEPVAWLARDLGSNRQNVQRIVNDLAREGFVAFDPNPHHRRAQLVVMTEKGRSAYDEAIRLWVPWANGLAEGLALDDLATMAAVVRSLRQRLEAETETSED